MKLLLGDCLNRLKELPDNSVDAIVTDPPYGWRFMGKAWDGADIEKHANWAINKAGPKVMADGKLRNPRPLRAEAAGKYDQTINGNLAFQVFTENWANEAFRVLKPGGHALIFCGPRTYHRMASGVEDAGFEIRDQIQWLFGSGFPKSHNLGDGRGTALKPANEPIVLARKPLSEKTVAKNVEKWGCGALNIDAGRIEIDFNCGGRESAKNTVQKTSGIDFKGNKTETHTTPLYNTQGRWPSNCLFDEEAAEALDEQSGTLKSGDHNNSPMGAKMGYCGGTSNFISNRKGDSGGASRFFYVAKASKRERNAGLEGMPVRESKHAYGDGLNSATKLDPKIHTEESVAARQGNQNHHPTVKPIKLMEYLIKLITPPNGIVLDPFMGSGSTGVAAKRLGFKFIGIEMNEEYLEIAKRRIG